MFRSVMLIWTFWGTFERIMPNPLEKWRSKSESQCFFDDRMHALRCRNTDLRHIQSGIDQLIFEIFVLDINFCDVSAIMEPLIGNHSMSELRTVTLVNSGLATIAENAFMGLEDHLEHLDLSGNRLTRVPSAILNMVKLISLDLSHNHIRALPPGSAFNNLNTLVRLDLSENLLGVSSSRSDGNDGEGNEEGPWEVDSSVPAEDESILKLSPGAELSLLSFNLEPLTDTLEELDLSSNQFSGLPSQFVNRTFARLRKLNLAQNPLKALSQAAFAGMSRLEVLNLAQTRLTTFVLDGMPPVLRELQLLGNPLQCDCQARWLWLHATKNQGDQLQSMTSLGQQARNTENEDEQAEKEPRRDENEQTTTNLTTRNQVVDHDDNESSREGEGEGGKEAETDPKTRLKIELPPCAAPFSVKSTKLTSLKDSELCGLLPGDRLPRFFRVTHKDKDSFPELTFESLHLMQVTPATDMVVNLTWSVDEPFYDTSYDWGVVFRQIGDETNPSTMFFKTKLDLARHVQKHPGWQPTSEVFEDALQGFEPDTYYEICLAAVHHSTVFYVHQSNCQEVRMLESLPSPRVNLNLQEYDTPNVTFSASETAITLEWKPFRENVINRAHPEETDENGNKSKIGVFRHISLREFGAANASEVAVVFEGFNSTAPPTISTSLRHTIPNLKPQTAYIVCFHSITREQDEEAWKQPLNREGEEKEELDQVVDASSNLEICREIVTSPKLVGTTFKSIAKETMEDISAPLATITPTDSMESPSSSSSGFPLTEVVAATVAASASTAIIVAILCCWCCGPRACCPPRTSERDNEAENEARTKGHERIGYNNENNLDGGESGSTKDENDNSTKHVMNVENMSINELNQTEVDQGFHHSYHPHHHSSFDMEPPSEEQKEGGDEDEEGEPDEEVASNQFKSSIISEISSRPSIDTVDYDNEEDDDELDTDSNRLRFQSKPNFQERFSDISIQGDRLTMEDTLVIPIEEKSNRSTTTTNHNKVSTQDRPRSSSSPSKFWPSCFSGNSSLYSQYDYTIHSEASPPSHLHESSHKSREIFSHGHSNQEAPSSSNQKCCPSKKKRRKSEGESHNRSHLDDPDETIGWRKRTTFADRPPHYTKKAPGGGILRQPSHNPVSLPRFSDPAPRLVDPGPASFHYPALGGGNYNTFSNYHQFYRRPFPANYAYMSPGEYYHGLNLVARPFNPRYAFDYSKTLGRKRRESPMAMVPVLSPPQHIAPPNPTPNGVVGGAMELKPINWKKIKSRGSSSHKSASDNYKMFTWSPYSSNVPVFFPEAAVFPVRLKHPNGKSLEDLRF